LFLKSIRERVTPDKSGWATPIRRPPAQGLGNCRSLQLHLNASLAAIVIDRKERQLLRAVVCSVFALVESLAQTPAAISDAPRFEVAAIHPTDPGEYNSSSGCSSTPGLLRCTNVTLKRCIVGAYGIGADRILGGPNWIEADRFQINARANEPIGDKGLMKMLQTLLAERFKLALHRDSRPGQTMVLEVATTGPKLQPSAAGSSRSWKNLHDHLEATRMTMGELAETLSRNLNLPVQDRTGLAGEFDFTLRWNPNDADVHERDEALAILRLEMSAAIVRQLGLTLKSRTLPVEILVVDHAERPSTAAN